MSKQTSQLMLFLAFLASICCISCTFPAYERGQKIPVETSVKHGNTVLWLTEEVVEAKKTPRMVSEGGKYLLWHWEGDSSQLDERNQALNEALRESASAFPGLSATATEPAVEAQWKVRFVLGDYIPSPSYRLYGPALNRMAIRENRAVTLVLFLKDSKDQEIGFIALDESELLQRSDVYPNVNRKLVQEKADKLYKSLQSIMKG